MRATTASVPAFQSLRCRHQPGFVAADHEAARRTEIDVGEVKLLARVGSDCKPGDDCIGILRLERRQKIVRLPRLMVQRIWSSAQIARARSTLNPVRYDRRRKEVERREIVCGDEAYRLHRAGRSALDAVLGVPEVPGSPAPHSPIRSTGPPSPKMPGLIARAIQSAIEERR